ncbi:MAG: ABC transporter permease [Termitinemataceae bacterium]|nr:MAG: ABC transporter permease [Termitinemataceae bacterium]
MHIIYAAAPLALAALGVLLTELSGSLTIAAEGFMVLGAFFSYFFTFLTGSALLGVLLSTILVAVLGFLLITYIQKCNADPFISALALNIAAVGITGTASRLFFGTAGTLRSLNFMLPQYSFVVLACIFGIAVWLLIKKTVFGLRLTACGNSKTAAIEHGIRVARYKAASWVAAAAACAVCGAAVSLRIGVYSPGGIAGRGWLAIAAVYLGFRSAPGAAAACLFAFIEQSTFFIQRLANINATLILGLPSLLAVILYACVRGRARGGSVRDAS